eukprot:TRINITY_DN67640_c8_g7_i1.p1 TRINITY_DN67640_c8_g7~~TRINITY_DN67640_c8_g7_i1.p1  ORF type:complete len:791 (-),score=65.37 TRINITY_DN67640_c8_g7_i1:477-2849(-)
MASPARGESPHKFSGWEPPQEEHDSPIVIDDSTATVDPGPMLKKEALTAAETIQQRIDQLNVVGASSKQQLKKAMRSSFTANVGENHSLFQGYDHERSYILRKVERARSKVTWDWKRGRFLDTLLHNAVGHDRPLDPKVIEYPRREEPSGTVKNSSRKLIKRYYNIVETSEPLGPQAVKQQLVKKQLLPPRPASAPPPSNSNSPANKEIVNTLTEEANSLSSKTITTAAGEDEDNAAVLLPPKPRPTRRKQAVPTQARARLNSAASVHSNSSAGSSHQKKGSRKIKRFTAGIGPAPHPHSQPHGSGDENQSEWGLGSTSDASEAPLPFQSSDHRHISPCMPRPRNYKRLGSANNFQIPSRLKQDNADKTPPSSQPGSRPGTGNSVRRGRTPPQVGEKTVAFGQSITSPTSPSTKYGEVTISLDTDAYGSTEDEAEGHDFHIGNGSTTSETADYAYRYRQWPRHRKGASRTVATNTSTDSNAVASAVAHSLTHKSSQELLDTSTTGKEPGYMSADVAAPLPVSIPTATETSPTTADGFETDPTLTVTSVVQRPPSPPVPDSPPPPEEEPDLAPAPIAPQLEKILANLEAFKDRSTTEQSYTGDLTGLISEGVHALTNDQGQQLIANGPITTTAFVGSVSSPTSNINPASPKDLRSVPSPTSSTRPPKMTPEEIEELLDSFTPPPQPPSAVGSNGSPMLAVSSMSIYKNVRAAAAAASPSTYIVGNWAAQSSGLAGKLSEPNMLRLGGPPSPYLTKAGRTLPFPGGFGGRPSSTVATAGLSQQEWWQGYVNM